MFWLSDCFLLSTVTFLIELSNHLMAQYVLAFRLFSAFHCCPSNRAVESYAVTVCFGFSDYFLLFTVALLIELSNHMLSQYVLAFPVIFCFSLLPF